jgi:hypothetical protein
MGVLMLTSIACSFAFISSGISLDFIRSFFCGVGLAVGASWVTMFMGVGEMYEHKITRIDRELKRYFVEDYAEDYHELEQMNTVEVLRKEMQGQGSCAENILVMAGKDMVQEYAALIRELKGKTLRKDTNIKIITYEGGDGAAHSAAFHYLKNNQQLTQGNGRSIVLIAGNTADDRQNFEHQLINGYKTLQTASLESDKGRGTKVFLSTRLRYNGPIEIRGEITMVGSWANLKQVESDGLKLVLCSQDGHARKLYHDFKVNAIVDKLERQFLTTVFDKSNSEKRQMPVLSDITIFKFNTPQKESDFVNLLDKCPDGFSITRDVFNPLILYKEENPNEMYKALITRDIENTDRDSMIGLYDEFVRRYGDGSTIPFDFNVYMPHLHETIISARPSAVIERIRTPLPLVVNAPSSRNSNHFDDSYEYSTPVEKARISLREWEQLLKEGNGLLSQQDAVVVMNKVKLIVNQTPYQVKKVLLDRSSLYAIYNDVHRLSLETIRALITSYEKIPEENVVEREKSRLLISELRQVAQYGLAYAGEIASLDDLELLSGYVMPAKSWFERSGVMDFMRFWFGFGNGLLESSFRVQNRARMLVTLGNIVDDNLYNAETVLQAVDDHVRSRLRPLSNKAIGIGRRWPYRKSVPRIAGLLVILYSIFDVALFHTGIPVGFLVSVNMFGVFSVGITWYHIQKGLHDNFAGKMREIDKLVNGLATHGYAQRFLEIEDEASEQALRLELQSKTPCADIVVIMTDSTRVEKYETLLSGWKGKLIRSDIPVKVVPYEGNDGAAYAAAFHLLQDKYPDIYRNGRALILVAGRGEHDKSDISRGLLNGYKAARSMLNGEGEGRGGKIFIDPALNYIGPVSCRGEITMQGSWANYQQAKDEALVVALCASDGRAHKLYPDIDHGIHDKLGRHHLLYDKSNPEKRQVPVLGGITIFNFRTLENQTQFVKLLDYCPPGFTIHRDVLSPLLLRKREGRAEMYRSLVSRNIVTQKAQRTKLLGLFDRYESEFGANSSVPFEFWINMPHLYETTITRGKSSPEGWAAEMAQRQVSAVKSLGEPLRIAGRLSSASAGMVRKSTDLKPFGRGVIAVSMSITESFKQQLIELADLESGGMGITLMPEDKSAQTPSYKLGNIVVPVDGAYLNVSVYRQLPANDGEKAYGIIMLDVDGRQLSPEAQRVADHIRVLADPQQEHYAMMLLGRGALSIVKELKDGKEEFKAALLRAGFSAVALEPAVLLLNDIGASYAAPRLLKDDYTYDPYLNSLVYPFIAYSLEPHIVPFSGAVKRSINPALSRYCATLPEKNDIDMLRAALLSVDTVLAVSGGERLVVGEEAPGLHAAVNTITVERFKNDLRLILQQYILNLCRSAYIQKSPITQATPAERIPAAVLDSSLLAPIIPVRTFSEIPEMANRLWEAGVKTMVLDRCTGDNHFLGLSRIDWITEAKRLKLDTGEINKIRTMLPDEDDELSDIDGLLENQFYIGFVVHNAMANNKEMRTQFNFFSRQAPWWPQIKEHARVLAFKRMNGEAPDNMTELVSWETKMNGDRLVKYKIYTSIYEYINYVAYLQLKGSISAVHREKPGMKVLINGELPVGNAGQWLKEAGFDSARPYPVLMVASAEELSAQRLKEAAVAVRELWVMISGDVRQDKGLLRGCLIKIAGSGVRLQVCFNITPEEVFAPSTPGNEDIISLLKSMHFPVEEPYNSERSFNDGYVRGGAMPFRRDDLIAVTKAAASLTSAVKFNGDSNRYFQNVYKALGDTGLTETVIPAVWNDIRAMQLRANMCQSDGDRLAVIDEVMGYFKGYLENATHQNAITQSGIRAHEAQDIFNAPLSEMIITMLKKA